ncbi:transcriptional regulator [Corynebacterium crudilactis]|uniref:Transcriptional regulator n=1 Tax=Corynebacterium crudilactis TaxID=1652495 RepID=A0A172QXF5_9CORY|nr:transcriptional regulator [Corynebacterium crudilactis]
METPAFQRQNTGIIALVAADASNPFFLEIFRGAQHAASTQGYTVVLVDARESATKSREVLEKVIPHADGLLLASSRMDSGEIQKVAREIPTVLMSREVQGIPSVMVDNYDGAAKAVVHLVDQGCRSITYIAGPDKSWADSTRWRGLVDAAAALALAAESGGEASKSAISISRSVTIQPNRMRHLIKPKVKTISVESPDFVGGRRAFEEWMKDQSDAVISFNDMVALGFMQQARIAGVKIPEDVAVVGFDNTEISVLSTPSLTTVAGPLRAVGRVATANLIALLKGMKAPLMSKPRELPTRLIVRESSIKTSPNMKHTS